MRNGQFLLGPYFLMDSVMKQIHYFYTLFKNLWPKNFHDLDPPSFEYNVIHLRGIILLVLPLYFTIWKCFRISWNYSYLVNVLHLKEFCEYYIRVEKFQIWDLQVGFDLKENVRFWYVRVNTCKVNHTCN